MKENSKKFFLLICFILIICLLCGCNKKNENNINSKVSSEIEYLDSELIDILNSLNGIDFSRYEVVIEEGVNKSSNNSNESSDKSSSKQKSNDDNSSSSSGNDSGNESSKEGEQEKKSSNNMNSSDDGEANKDISVMKSKNILSGDDKENWSELLNKIERLYNSWPPIASDFKKIGVNENDIYNFEENLDLVAVFIKNKEKEQAINTLVDMYKCLLEFSEKNDKKEIINCKYELLLCYKNVNMEEWDLLGENLKKLNNDFNNIKKNYEKYKGKQSNIDNCGVILREMSNSEQLKDDSVFFIKYKNLIQELNNIV